MKMAYSGSHAVVDVPALGLFGVPHGEPVEIDESAATVRQLRRQGWRKVSTTDNDGKGDD